MERFDTPHFRYADYPHKVMLYTDGDEGSATFEIATFTERLFFRSSAQEYDNTASYSYDEALELLAELGKQIQAMAEWHETRGVRWANEDVPPRHQWLGTCKFPDCEVDCHTDPMEVVELNRQVMPT